MGASQPNRHGQRESLLPFTPHGPSQLESAGEIMATSSLLADLSYPAETCDTRRWLSTIHVAATAVAIFIQALNYANPAA